jgi:hypothetical protein
MKKSDFEKSSWKNKQKIEKKCDSDGVASVARAFHFAQPFYALRGGPPAWLAACGRLLPPWIPLPVRACVFHGMSRGSSKVSLGLGKSSWKKRRGKVERKVRQ